MKKEISWFAAILITFTIAIFQLIMGTANPLAVQVNTGKQLLQCELTRTYNGKTDCPIILPIGDIKVSGSILYRVYPSESKMSRIDFDREGDKLIANLPSQPPSGKLEYRVFLEREGTTIYVNEGKPVIIRFLGKVPIYILILQSILIFLAILFSNITGIYAGLGIKSFKWMIYLDILILLAVIFLLQPLMHKYALNQWWTCFPNSWEAGDNKLLIALMVWLVTAYFNLKKNRRGLVVIASIISIFMFSVPHGFPGFVHDPITLNSAMSNLLPLLQLF